MRDLVYYVATSLDGFIADPEGDFSAFPNSATTVEALFARYPETCPVHVRETWGVTAEARRFDTVLMGYRTYLPALEAGLPAGAYPHLRQIVVTHRQLPEGAPEAIGGDLAETVMSLKAQPGSDIWLCGGADLAGQLVELIDELQIKINPLTLGSGTPLFTTSSMARRYALTDLERLPGDVVLATYRKG